MYSTSSNSSSSSSQNCADAPNFSFDDFQPVCTGFEDQKLSGILSLTAFPHCPSNWGLSAGEPLFCVSCEDQIDDTGSFQFSSNPTKKPRRIGCGGETVDVVMQEQFTGTFQLSNARHRAYTWGSQGIELGTEGGDFLRWAMSLRSRVGRDPRQDAVTLIAQGRDSGDPLIVMFSAFPMADQFQVKFSTDDFWRFPVSFSLQSIKQNAFTINGQTIDMSEAGSSFGIWGELA